MRIFVVISAFQLFENQILFEPLRLLRDHCGSAVSFYRKERQVAAKIRKDKPV